MDGAATVRAADAVDADAAPATATDAAADLPELSDAERAQREVENAMFEELEEPRTYVLPVSAPSPPVPAKPPSMWRTGWRITATSTLPPSPTPSPPAPFGRFRKEVVATDVDSAIAGLQAIAEGTESPDVYSGHHVALEGPVWVYSGFGGQHRKMGKRLYLADKFRGDFGGNLRSLPR
ncbi:MAG: hypothetical protein U1U88_001141 [Lawsonella clevelandensis]